MTEGNGVPFLDLITPHLELEDELLAAVREIVRSGGFIGGPVVERFERNFAEACGGEYSVGVGSGTDALRFALIAAGVRPGDVVVTVPNTFVATVEAIVQAGAWPRFVDVDPATFNMSVSALREFLEARCEIESGSGALLDRESGRPVTSVVPVHLYGQMCDMDPIVDLAGRYGLTIVEDACQAHGSTYFSREKQAWQRAGSIGAAGAFSFYPGKNLGACGEAGAVTTNDAQIAGRVRMIRDHGQSRKYYYQVEGYNGRLDAVQAALLEVKLPHLEAWNRKRRAAAAVYQELLAGADGIRTPVEPEWSRAVYHLYVVRAENRDALGRHLSENNIGTGLHYPVPLHLQAACARLGYGEGDFPVAEKAAREILSLPMFPQILRGQQEHVAAALVGFCQTQASRV